jgi:preprotein translocase subunit SecG
MTVLGINFLNVSITALLVVYVFVCLAMILLVLMQRPKQEGLGAAFGANTTDQLFGARTTNVLQKGTVYLSVMFFVLTLTLGILVQKKNKIASLAKAPEPTTEVAPAEPVKSLSEELPVTPPTQPTPPTEPTPTPEGQTPAEDKPAEDKPAEDKPAEDKPAEDKPAEDKPAEDKPAEDKPAEDKPAEPAEVAPPAEEDKTPPQ